MNEVSLPEPQIPKPLSFEELLNPQWSNMGHGTSPESAEVILKEGIRLNPNYGIPEIFHWPDNPSMESLQQEFNNWPHKNSKAIIVVSVHTEKYSFEDTILDEINDERKGKRAYVDPKYIRGYYDVDRQQFVDNNVWDQNPTFLKKKRVFVKPHLPDTVNSSRKKLQAVADNVGLEDEVW